jgi:hypothetical protein
MPSPAEYCDIVMKGGVTSGVVYPRAAVELSKKYTFKNLGGTSAGAIAAAATAAAEYRRRHGSDAGFVRLAQLPAELAQPGFLLSLFTPDGSTRRLFMALQSAATASQSGAATVAIKLWLALLAGYPGPAIAGALLGAVLPVLLWWAGWASGLAAVLLGVLWVLAVMTLFATVAAATSLPTSLRANRFGLSSGKPLVAWLNSMINDTAGLPAGKFLTFKDLHDAPRPNDVTNTPRAVNLEMMTTNLTHGRPYRLPFSQDSGARFYFAPSEWLDFFPPDIVEYLKSLTPAGATLPRSSEGLDLYQVPFADLPVVVAVRMSLSFPGLFSAVPLWAVDFTRTMNTNDHTPGFRPTAERCWFSDGGLSSNFPVHLFDAPLPRWPTFAIDLKGPHPDHLEKDEMVWLPAHNASGFHPVWNRFDKDEKGQLPLSDPKQLLGFGLALVDAMQSWRDSMAAEMPGYRDRIVHISQLPNEGGLNLAMPPPLITELSGRGQLAGQRLVNEFKFDNHVWTRYRVYADVLWQSLQKFAHSYEAPMPQGAHAWTLVTGTATAGDLPSYKLTPAEYAALSGLTAACVSALEGTPEPVAITKSPHPEPELRVTQRV